MFKKKMLVAFACAATLLTAVMGDALASAAASPSGIELKEANVT